MLKLPLRRHFRKNSWWLFWCWSRGRSGIGWTLDIIITKRCRSRCRSRCRCRCRSGRSRWSTCGPEAVWTPFRNLWGEAVFIDVVFTTTIGHLSLSCLRPAHNNGSPAGTKGGTNPGGGSSKTWFRESLQYTPIPSTCRCSVQGPTLTASGAWTHSSFGRSGAATQQQLLAPVLLQLKTFFN